MARFSAGLHRTQEQQAGCPGFPGCESQAHLIAGSPGALHLCVLSEQEPAKGPTGAANVTEKLLIVNKNLGNQLSH